MFTERDIGLNSISGILASTGTHGRRVRLKGLDTLAIVRSGPTIKRIKYADFLSPYLESLGNAIEQVWLPAPSLLTHTRQYSLNSSIGIQKASEGVPVLSLSQDKELFPIEQAEKVQWPVSSYFCFPLLSKALESLLEMPKPSRDPKSSDSDSLDDIPKIYYDPNFNLSTDAPLTNIRLYLTILRKPAHIQCSISLSRFRH